MLPFVKFRLWVRDRIASACGGAPKVVLYFSFGLVSAIVLFIIFLKSLPDDNLYVYFLDVGQGDSTLIRTPSNRYILIDGGPGNKVLEELGEVLPFFSRTLDLVVLTHPHADHIMGLIPLLERYEIKHILYTGAQYQSQLYKEFLRLLSSRNISSHIARSDKDFRIGNDVFLDVLYPISDFFGQQFANINNSSVVSKLSFGKTDILFPGDAEQEEESKLLDQRVDLSADVLKAGHHGSRTSSTDDFLDAVDPEYAVIQSGKGNSYGHPHPETILKFLSRGIEIFRNDIHGRVTMVFSQDGLLQIETEKEDFR